MDTYPLLWTAGTMDSSGGLTSVLNFGNPPSHIVIECFSRCDICQFHNASEENISNKMDLMPYLAEQHRRHPPSVLPKISGGSSSSSTPLCHLETVQHNYILRISWCLSEVRRPLRPHSRMVKPLQKQNSDGGSTWRALHLLTLKSQDSMWRALHASKTGVRVFFNC